MLGSFKDDVFHYKTPQAAGGVTQAPLSMRRRYRRAFRPCQDPLGAEIILELKDTDYGSRGIQCERSQKGMSGISARTRRIWTRRQWAEECLRRT